MLWLPFSFSPSPSPPLLNKALLRVHTQCGYPPPPSLEKYLPMYFPLGGWGTVTLSFPILFVRLDIEVLLCVHQLGKVVFLVHRCVIRIYCMQGSMLYPVSCRILSFSQLGKECAWSKGVYICFC